MEDYWQIVRRQKGISASAKLAWLHLFELAGGSVNCQVRTTASMISESQGNKEEWFGVQSLGELIEEGFVRECGDLTTFHLNNPADVAMQRLADFDRLLARFRNYYQGRNSNEKSEIGQWLERAVSLIEDCPIESDVVLIVLDEAAAVEGKGKIAMRPSEMLAAAKAWDAGKSFNPKER